MLARAFAADPIICWPLRDVADPEPWLEACFRVWNAANIELGLVSEIAGGAGGAKGGTHKTGGQAVPLIQADIRRGRTTQQRDQLVSELTRIVHEVSGAPIDTISAVVRELPGPATYEAGIPSPEYQPGPDGTDLAAVAELASRPSAGPGPEGDA
jgi:phenylpyruvate tautomerase PptA (4-oxalocrotonate tautomerase family)